MNKENVNQKFAIYITTAGQSGGIFAPKMTSYLHFLSQPTKESKFNQSAPKESISVLQYPQQRRSHSSQIILSEISN